MKYLFPCFGLLFFLFSCKQKEPADDPEETPVVQTPVTVTTISTETISDSLVLNATSTYTQDNVVKSAVNGYIKDVSIKPGQYTNAGRNLFTIRTKEAESLGNTINKLDSEFHFTGIVHIAAPQSGYVVQLNHQLGDYVQDGEQLAVISNSNSFGFVLNIPYEYSDYIRTGKPVSVVLPDGRVLPGAVASLLPTIDSVSQTLTAMVKVVSSQQIPANLIAKVHLLKEQKNGILSLPKAALLTDESQTDFWVMKLIDSVTAVKVSVVKGMEAGDRVEIVSPKFLPGDKIVLTGNYGLADTAKVKIITNEE